MRLPARAISNGIASVCVLVVLVLLAVRTTTFVLGSDFGEPSANHPVLAALLCAQYGLVLFALSRSAATIQVVGLYLFRDRGKHVVAYRLDAAGCHHVMCGTDIVIPWTGMVAMVTERVDDHYHVRFTSDGPFTARWDPASRQARRTVRKERGLTILLTTSNPTEDELATAIATRSAGQVELAR